MRSSGDWQVALDPEAGPWKTSVITLRDAAISTSGVYRRGPNGTTNTGARTTFAKRELLSRSIDAQVAT